jgi:hypothetical protein
MASPVVAPLPTPLRLPRPLTAAPVELAMLQPPGNTTAAAAAPAYSFSLSAPTAMRGNPVVGGAAPCADAGSGAPVSTRCHMPGLAVDTASGVVTVAGADALPGGAYSGQVMVEDTAGGGTAAVDFTVELVERADPAAVAAAAAADVTVAFTAASPAHGTQAVVLAGSTATVTVGLSVTRGAAAAGGVALPHLSILGTWQAGASVISDCPHTTAAADAAFLAPYAQAAPGGGSGDGTCTATVRVDHDRRREGLVAPLCFDASVLRFNASGAPAATALPPGEWLLPPTVPATANVSAALAMRRCVFVRFGAAPAADAPVTPATDSCNPAVQDAATAVVTPASPGRPAAALTTGLAERFDDDDDDVTAAGATAAAGVAFTRHGLPVLAYSGTVRPRAGPDACPPNNNSTATAAAAATNTSCWHVFPPLAGSNSVLLRRRNGSPGAGRYAAAGHLWYPSRLPLHTGWAASVRLTVPAGGSGRLAYAALLAAESASARREDVDHRHLVAAAALYIEGRSRPAAAAPVRVSLAALRLLAAFSGVAVVFEPAGAAGTAVAVLACNATVAAADGPECTLAVGTVAMQLTDGRAHVLAAALNTTSGTVSARIDGALALAHPVAGRTLSPWRGHVGVVIAAAPDCAGGGCTFDAPAAAAKAVALMDALRAGVVNASTGDAVVAAVTAAGSSSGAWVYGGVSGATFAGSDGGRAGAAVIDQLTVAVSPVSSDHSYAEWLDRSASVSLAAGGVAPAALFRLHLRDACGLPLPVDGDARLLDAVRLLLTTDRRTHRVVVTGTVGLGSVVEGYLYATVNTSSRAIAAAMPLWLGSAYIGTHTTSASDRARYDGDASALYVLPSMADGGNESSSTAAVLLNTLQRVPSDGNLGTLTAGTQLSTLVVLQDPSGVPLASSARTALITGSVRFPPDADEWVVGASRQHASSSLRVVASVAADGSVQLLPATTTVLTWTLTAASPANVCTALLLAADGVPLRELTVHVTASVASPFESYVTLCNDTVVTNTTNASGGGGVNTTCAPLDALVDTSALGAPLLPCIGGSGSGCVGYAGAAVGTPITALVVLRDAYGNVLPAVDQAAAVPLLVVSMAPRGSGAPAANTTCQPAAVGGTPCCAASFTPTVPGAVDISASLAGAPIQLSPVSVVVTADRASATTSAVLVDDCAPLTHVFAGVTGSVRLRLRDAYDNAAAALRGDPYRDGGGALVWDGVSAQVLAPDAATCAYPTAGVWLSQVSPAGAPGVYELSFNSSCAGWFTVNVTTYGTSVPVTIVGAGCSLPAAVPPRPLPPPAAHVYVAPTTVSPAMSLVTRLWNATLTAGLRVTVAHVVPRDVFGNPRPVGADALYVDVAIQQGTEQALLPARYDYDDDDGSATGAALGYRPLNITSTWATNVTLTPSGDGYDVSLLPTAAGSYNLTLLLDAPFAALFPQTPTSFSVRPGPVEPAACVVSGAVAGGAVGALLRVAVAAADSFGNVRSDGDGDVRLLVTAAQPSLADISAAAGAASQLSYNATAGVYSGAYTLSNSSAAYLSVLINTTTAYTSGGGLRHAAGSPFAVSGTPTAATDAVVVVPSSVLAAGGATALPNVTSAAATTVALQLLDDADRPWTPTVVNTTLAALAAKLVAGALADNSAAAAAPAAPGTVADMTYAGSGVLHVTYGCKADGGVVCTAGRHTLVVTLNGTWVRTVGVSADVASSPLVVDNVTSAADCAVHVLPAPADADTSTAGLKSATVVAADAPAGVSVQLRDVTHSLASTSATELAATATHTTASDIVVNMTSAAVAEVQLSPRTAGVYTVATTLTASVSSACGSNCTALLPSTADRALLGRLEHSGDSLLRRAVPSSATLTVLPGSVDASASFVELGAVPLLHVGADATLSWTLRDAHANDVPAASVSVWLVQSCSGAPGGWDWALVPGTLPGDLCTVTKADGVYVTLTAHGGVYNATLSGTDIVLAGPSWLAVYADGVLLSSVSGDWATPVAVLSGTAASVATISTAPAAGGVSMRAGDTAAVAIVVSDGADNVLAHTDLPVGAVVTAAANSTVCDVTPASSQVVVPYNATGRADAAAVAQAAPASPAVTYWAHCVIAAPGTYVVGASVAWPSGARLDSSVNATLTATAGAPHMATSLAAVIDGASSTSASAAGLNTSAMSSVAAYPLSSSAWAHANSSLYVAAPGAALFVNVSLRDAYGNRVTDTNFSAWAEGTPLAATQLPVTLCLQQVGTDASGVATTGVAAVDQGGLCAWNVSLQCCDSAGAAVVGGRVVIPPSAPDGATYAIRLLWQSNGTLSDTTPDSVLRLRSGLLTGAPAAFAANATTLPPPLVVVVVPLLSAA